MAGSRAVQLSWGRSTDDRDVISYDVLQGDSKVHAASRDRAVYGFCVRREAGVTHRVRIRAKLPDGTWGGFSAERTVTAEALRRSAARNGEGSPGGTNPSPGRGRSACGTGRGHVGSP